MEDGSLSEENAVQLGQEEKAALPGIPEVVLALFSSIIGE